MPEVNSTSLRKLSIDCIQAGSCNQQGAESSLLHYWICITVAPVHPIRVYGVCQTRSSLKNRTGLCNNLFNLFIIQSRILHFKHRWQRTWRSSALPVLWAHRNHREASHPRKSTHTKPLDVICWGTCVCSLSFLLMGVGKSGIVTCWQIESDRLGP